MRMRPLHRVHAGVWKSCDHRWTFMRHESDPQPKRWFAYWDGDEYPANDGQGHTTLHDVVTWATAQGKVPA